MKILAIVPGLQKTGASLYSNKLYRRLPAETLPGDDSSLHLLSELLRRDADAYHIQFEYRGFGSFPRSLSLLILLTVFLRLRRAVVITLHGVIVPESVMDRRWGWFSYFLFLSSVRLAGLFASAFIVHSQLMKTVLKRVYGIEKSVVIPCGSDWDELRSETTHDPRRLVFFGFLRPSKGIENLIDALVVVRSVFPNVGLTIAGSIARRDEAYYLTRLHQRVEKYNLGDSVSFRDTVFGSVTERTRLLSDAIAIVLPYTDNFIEISAVVHDVSEYGVPIICSRTPRFSELVEGLDCIKVSPTPADLADAIVRIIRDPVLRSKLGANIRLKAQQQSWDKIAHHHLLLYTKLLSGEGLIEDFVS